MKEQINADELRAEQVSILEREVDTKPFCLR